MSNNDWGDGNVTHTERAEKQGFIGRHINGPNRLKIILIGAGLLILIAIYAISSILSGGSGTETPIDNSPQTPIIVNPGVDDDEHVDEPVNEETPSATEAPEETHEEHEEDGTPGHDHGNIDLPPAQAANLESVVSSFAAAYPVKSNSTRDSWLAQLKPLVSEYQYSTLEIVDWTYIPAGSAASYQVLDATVFYADASVTFSDGTTTRLLLEATGPSWLIVEIG